MFLFKYLQLFDYSLTCSQRTRIMLCVTRWLQTSISWKKLKKTQGNAILGQNSICTSTKCIAIHVSRNVLFCGFASFWKQSFSSPPFPHRSNVYQELISYCNSICEHSQGANCVALYSNEDSLNCNWVTIS